MKPQILLRWTDKEHDVLWRIVKQRDEFYLELYEQELDENNNTWNRVYYWERLTEYQVSRYFQEQGKTWNFDGGYARG